MPTASRTPPRDRPPLHPDRPADRAGRPGPADPARRQLGHPALPGRRHCRDRRPAGRAAARRRADAGESFRRGGRAGAVSGAGRCGAPAPRPDERCSRRRARKPIISPGARRASSELGGRTSLLNPLWYAGSFAIGALAGLAGDRTSLGFVAETERQVVEHLEGHLHRLPQTDARTRAIVQQMSADEAASRSQRAAARAAPTLPAAGARGDEADRANHDAHGVLDVAQRARHRPDERLRSGSILY